MRKINNFKSGNATLKLNITGKLKDAAAGLKFGLDNLSVSDKSMSVYNEKLTGDFLIKAKELSGKINNDNFRVYLPSTASKIAVPKLNIEVADNNITIKENSILFNDKSSLKYSGGIVDYNKLKSINFNTNGSINTDDLIKLIGREFKPFIHSQGSIPVKLTFDGDRQKQTLFAQAMCDKENFHYACRF